MKDKGFSYENLLWVIAVMFLPLLFMMEMVGSLLSKYDHWKNAKKWSAVRQIPGDADKIRGLSSKDRVRLLSKDMKEVQK